MLNLNCVLLACPAMSQLTNVARFNSYQLAAVSVKQLTAMLNFLPSAIWLAKNTISNHQINSQTSSSALLLKVSREATLPSFRAATTFWSLTNATAKTAAVLLSIRLFGLRLSGSWFFCDSFSRVRPLSLLNWYSVSNWESSGVGDHSCSSLLSYSLICFMSTISGSSLFKGLSKPNISLR